MSRGPQGLFVDGADGRPRFYLYHRPSLSAGEARGCVVFVHPFAEEMNKSRRMAALQSRALAGAGFAVLQPDLLGCGDSEGDFGDATWSDWVMDVVHAAQWLGARHPEAPLWLWGLRTGCLLACEATSRLTGPVNQLYWQPAVQGRALLQQFLRVATAGQWLDGKSAAPETAPTSHKAQLSRGHKVEVAGYLLSPGLASGLEAARLAPPRDPARAIWIEVSSRPNAELLLPTRNAEEAWRAGGWQVTTALVQGPAFWQTQAIEEAPALVSATLSAVEALELA